ncbi:glycosyl transferase family 1 [Fadolivirus algeromassiliense]|jgi:glycosyltransferase involved in cell wall biosynthesis|uniref:Glycosyl transferase family 1 n=1 Tax=Fadolivirus FV1/VV64 TaxID=3070911 RepID=A0A7D3QXK4_9VIRU|nr:glycosyl transferase family 1 [Fadolivirus algeromassiliense]QKF94560.1 glycosyl transferase family 1 [Fadolivirus FV1/VV64]
MEEVRFKNKRYAIVTKIGYPFGGGEEYLLQTMQWNNKLGLDSYWICFTNAKHENYNFSIEIYSYGTIIRLPGGFNLNTICNWLILLKPDIVHQQGAYRKEIYDICEKLRIEFFTGFHFWNGALKLDIHKKNINILENIQYHKPDEELQYLATRKFCTMYTVSTFVADCIDKITGIKINNIIYSAASKKNCKVENLDIVNNEFVTMINIHKLKGGELFLYLIENMKNIPFLGIKTEPNSEELDALIEEAINKRNAESDIKCKLINRSNDVKEIYKQTKILLVPSLVDETFCRVANEAMLNGIPIITTGAGNIKYLVGETSDLIIPTENNQEWISKINELYFNHHTLLSYSQYVQQRYENFSEDKAFELFTTHVTNILNKSKSNNIMILCPWCDQGLGIQSRNYYNILKDDYNIFIFSFKPYNANSCIQLQKNPEEWIVDNVYYSENDREHIKDNELINFVEKYNIGKCLLPETCWFRTFEIAQLLKKLNVRCYAIPNIEIVRRDEIHKHKYFYKILCNNQQCMNYMNMYNIKNTQYIGYSFNNLDIAMKKKNIDDNLIKFLFIGGMNSFSRKQLLEVLQSFVRAYQTNNNIRLTCTIQMVNLKELDKKEKVMEFINHPAINIIDYHLAYNDIIDLYYNHHASILVSKQEGLGLGFYEALATGTPVITLDTQPHNEIIKENVNGWIIPCYYKKMDDNNSALFDSAYFEVDVLANKFIDVSNEYKNKYENLSISLINDYESRLSNEVFKKNIIDALEN